MMVLPKEALVEVFGAGCDCKCYDNVWGMGGIERIVVDLGYVYDQNDCVRSCGAKWAHFFKCAEITDQNINL